ncbi:MAG: type II toxin-antitoxin system RelE/ParE family toxin [Clostridium sp.]|nr:type II toxin-antitoxin system RelE/ParE family toxin [Clostridium sp.]
MIKSFKDKETERIFNGLNSKKFTSVQKVAKRKLDMLHYAYKEQDLIVPPSNRFEHLKGDLKGYCSIRINDQFRVIFKFENGCAYDVQIVDYH